MTKELNIKLAEGGPDEMPTSVNDHTYYPTLHFNEKEGIDLPKEGLMVIKYKKVGSSESTDRSGKTRYSCTVEVHEIKSVEYEKPEAPAKSYDEAGDALDKLAAKKMKEEGY